MFLFLNSHESCTNVCARMFITDILTVISCGEEMTISPAMMMMMKDVLNMMKI